MERESSATKSLIALLQRASPLAWYKYGPDSNDPMELSMPPLVVWRFERTLENQEEVNRIEQLITDAIQEYHGEVEWFLAAPGFNGHNWALWTKRCQELMESTQFECEGYERVICKQYGTNESFEIRLETGEAETVMRSFVELALHPRS